MMLDADGTHDGGGRVLAGCDGPGIGRGDPTWRTRADNRPVLIVMHQEHSTSGHIGNLLDRHGVDVDVRRPRFGERLPATLADHAGAVVFGGPMSANDDDGYIHSERRLIEVALKEERPFLGVCLGGQLLALELGAKVWADEQGRVEIGYHKVEPRDVVEGLAPAWPTCFYQWHREGFDLPRGAVHLAGAGGPFANQAFRYGPAAFSFQFHPEITYAMVARWTRNESRLELPGASPRRQQLEDHFAHAPIVLGWLERFMGEWLGLNEADKLTHDSHVCNLATDQV